jgi:hypothetical protein
MMSKFMTIALLAAGVFSASAYGAAQAQVYSPAYGANQAPAYNAPQSQPEAEGPDMASPGAVNYVEGSVLLDGTPLARRDVGRATLEPGEVLSTEKGRAEVLLTPGVFLRLDNNSAVKMISPDLIRTQVELTQGRAALEVDQLFPQNDLEIIDGGVTTQLVKPGFYEFNAGQPTAMVFTGRAEIHQGNGKSKEIKDHHEAALAVNVIPRSRSFDPHDAQDEFFNWSSLRSQYLAEANNQIAGQYAGVEGFNPGWYWNPNMWDYTFIGLGPYWSPFGFGFYPPWGWYGGFWRGGFYGGQFYGPRGFYGGYARGAYAGRGFSGGGGFAGGGFHGGGGGGRR